jgi:hypothetical protein
METWTLFLCLIFYELCSDIVFYSAHLKKCINGLNQTFGYLHIVILYPSFIQSKYEILFENFLSSLRSFAFVIRSM